MIPHWLEETIAPLEKRLSKHPRSPLFAQLAGFYLEAGKPQDALRICDEGLANHSLYSTGHLMKGKALVALNMPAEARREFELVHSLLPGVESVARLLSETSGGPETELSTPSPPAESVAKSVGTRVTAAAPPPVETAAVAPVVEEPPVVVAEAPSAPIMETPMVETPIEPIVAEEEPSPFGGMEAPAIEPTLEVPVGDESIEQFSERTRQELAGTENTLTLDDYFSGVSAPADPGSGNQIEDLAEKLQGAKMTPVINLSSKSSEGASGGAKDGFVTPTLAEIYVKQGWFDDAIKAYKALAATKPDEKEKFEQRVAEIEEMKKQQGG